jgi:hypothetical protein
MKAEIHSLHWNNVDQRLVQAQKTVLDKFGLSINYTKGNYPHGAWMDHVCRNSDADVLVFFDADCVPLDREIVDESIAYAIKNDSFVGLAQASNHIPPFSHVFAAPSFFVITRSCYEKLGSPSFSETRRSDVAQELSYIAEEKRKRYRCLYPTKFDGVPVEGVWRLSNYGLYGIGTLFANRVYHLYQGRFNHNVDLFCRRCEQIVQGNFDVTEMHDSLKEFDGKVVA